MKDFLIGISLLCLSVFSLAQEIIRYDEKNPTAKVLKHEFLTNHYYERNQVLEHPIVGTYSPTSYSSGPRGIEPDRGICNYIYIPTQGKLKPGKQYTLNISIKMDEAYDELGFFQDHFGVALTSYLYDNNYSSYWGLWRHSKESLGNLVGDEVLTIRFDFRPLCQSKYFVLGVFKDETMDPLSCFGCEYLFELHNLSISESQYPEQDCLYFCDGFKDPPPTLTRNEMTVYFDSGSAEINESYNVALDSIPSKLKSPQDLILLSAYTDRSGQDNEALGSARNESVRQALIKRGIASRRIEEINHSDTKSAKQIESTDRKVEIDFGGGKQFKKLYMAALDAAAKEDYPTAHKIMMKEWVGLVPSKKAIYAIYDNWGDSDKALIFKEHLLGAIKSKYYHKQELRFSLDSIRCEYLKGRGLIGHLYLNRMPKGERINFSFKTSYERDSLLKKEVDKVYTEIGFPKKGDVGRVANQVLPDIIMTSDDTSYLEKYLPLVLDACEKEELRWRVYAGLYDKILVLKTGYQRYGTKMVRSGNTMKPEFPFEDESKVDEYRRQVKLAPFTKPMKSAYVDAHKNLDKELVNELNEIYIADQHHRNKHHEGWRDFKKLRETDSLNQIRVKKILDERGWLGPDIVSPRGNTTLFLVVQHSDLEMQLKYLPMMRTAVKQGAAKGSDLALLEDRVALAQGKKQIYGSQIYEDNETGEHYVAPIENPDKVNELRAKVGLMNIEDYVRRWNIIWNVDEHKKRRMD